MSAPPTPGAQPVPGAPQSPVTTKRKGPSIIKKLMPLWYGLGALAGLAGIGALIYFFGGGKFSGTRLEEIKSTEITWKLSGSTGGGLDHDGPMIELVSDLNLKVSGMNITPAPCQVGWPSESRRSIKATYKDNEGNKTVTGRVVEYIDDVKRAEFIVVNGLMDGAASAWDKNGYVIFMKMFHAVYFFWDRF